MIQANELKLGNYLFDTVKKINIQVKKEHIDHINQCNFLNACTKIGNIDIGFEPIPITKERLLKYGFEHYRVGLFGNGFKIGTFELLYNNKKYIFVPYPSFEIEYVHQLQNLYFSFTQTELEIK